MEKKLLARWESKNGKISVELYKDVFGYFFTTFKQMGEFTCPSDDDAIKFIGEKALPHLIDGEYKRMV